MSPEDREARAEELRGQIARTWLRYAIVEGIAIGIPGLVLLVVWSSDAVSGPGAFVAFFVLFAACLGMLGYTLLRQAPRSRELRALEEASRATRSVPDPHAVGRRGAQDSP